MGRRLPEWPRILAGDSCLTQDLLEMLDTPFRLIDGTAFDAENDIPRGLPANLYDFPPVDNAFAASTSDSSPCHFSSFGLRLFNRDILRVNVNETVHNPFQPSNRVLSSQIRIACIKIDTNDG